MRFPSLFLIVALFVPLTPAHAALKTEVVEYKQDGTVLEGYLAWDTSFPGPRPGVLIVPDWMGVGPYVKSRAEQLAKMGYVAFAADVFGKGVRPRDAKAASKLAAEYKAGDRRLFRARVRAGLDRLLKEKRVDSRKAAAIGYCFGGTGALELARTGAPLLGTVSFHGGLDTPDPSLAKNIRGKVLALHGADDPYVPPKDVAAFQDEMRSAKVDWQLHMYGGAVHAFTIPDAGNDPSKGVAYDKKADERSLEAMKDFFAEIFR